MPKRDELRERKEKAAWLPEGSFREASASQNSSEDAEQTPPPRADDTQPQPSDSGWLLVRLNKQLAALPLDGVVEVCRPLPISSLSSAPSGVVGLALFRGEYLPVLELTCLVNPDHPAPGSSARSVREDLLASESAGEVRGSGGAKSLGSEEVGVEPDGSEAAGPQDSEDEAAQAQLSGSTGAGAKLSGTKQPGSEVSRTEFTQSEFPRSKPEKMSEAEESKEAEESERPSRSSRAQRFVVLKVQGRRLIVQVPRVLEVIPAGALEIEGLPPLLRGRSSPAINALSKLDHELILLLSLGKLVPPGWLGAGSPASTRDKGERENNESNGDLAKETAEESSAREMARRQQEHSPPPEGGGR